MFYAKFVIFQTVHKKSAGQEQSARPVQAEIRLLELVAYAYAEVMGMRMSGLAGYDNARRMAGSGVRVVQNMVVNVHIGQVKRPVLVEEADAGGIVVAAVGRNHVVGIAGVHGGSFVHETEAQGHPVHRLVFAGEAECPAVSPVPVGILPGVDRAFHIHVEVSEAAPERVDGIGFKTQVVQRLIGNAESDGIRQMECAAETRILDRS